MPPTLTYNHSHILYPQPRKTDLSTSRVWMDAWVCESVIVVGCERAYDMCERAHDVWARAHEVCVRGGVRVCGKCVNLECVSVWHTYTCMHKNTWPIHIHTHIKHKMCHAHTHMTTTTWSYTHVQVLGWGACSCSVSLLFGGRREVVKGKGMRAWDEYGQILH